MQLSPGDLLEIRLPDGFAYLQVTHNHPAYPEVVRVLGGRHRKRPDSLDALAAGESILTAMVPVGAAIDRANAIVRKIGQAAIPARHREFPTFRMAIRDRDGNIAYWWFWDGEGLRYDTEPGDAEENLPMRETVSVEALIDRLARLQRV